MARRSYGRGSNAEDATLREQLLQLLSVGGPGNGGTRGGGRGGGGGGKGGGSGRGGGGNTAAATRPQQPRSGDWSCAQCQFVNFGFRRQCLRCKAAVGGQQQRALSVPHAGPLRPHAVASPVRRPATAAEARSAAARAGQPSFHVPRPAAAAGVAPAAGDAPPAARIHADGHGSSAPSCGMGGQSGGGAAPTSWASSVQPGPVSVPSVHVEHGEASSTLHRRGRWADDTPPCDRMQEDDIGDDDSAYAGDDVAHEDREADERENAWDSPPPSVETLRARWAAECKVVKALERVEWDIGQGQSAALYAAQRARDDAEREWRNAAAPKPVAVRMGVAQRKLNKAQKAVDKSVAALREYEAEVAQRREELRGAVQYAEGRRDQRQQELDELHREAGAIAASATTDGAAVAGAATGAERLLDEMVREVQAIVETLDEGSDARGRVNLLLARVATRPEYAEPTGCQSFDIGTDGEEHQDACGKPQAATRKGRDGSGSLESTPARREAVWNEAAVGRWCKHKQGASGGAMSDERAGATTTTATSARDKASDPAGAAAATAGTATPPHHPSAAVGTDAAQGSTAPVGTTTSGKGGRPPPSDYRGEQPPNKSHRGHDVVEGASVEGACDDAARALKLMGEQEAAIKAAQAANATFGDATSMQIAGQLYAHKVQLAADRAKAAGVRPEVDGVQLIQLPPDAFNRWVAEVLAPAEKAMEEAEGREL